MKFLFACLGKTLESGGLTVRKSQVLRSPCSKKPMTSCKNFSWSLHFCKAGMALGACRMTL